MKCPEIVKEAGFNFKAIKPLVKNVGKKIKPVAGRYKEMLSGSKLKGLRKGVKTIPNDANVMNAMAPGINWERLLKSDSARSIAKETKNVVKTRVGTGIIGAGVAGSLLRKKKKTAEVGKGIGMGGSIQGDGGVAKCKCPKCGNVMDHPRGTPCTSIKCSKCGTKMVGKE